jgi:heme oxygenase
MNPKIKDLHDRAEKTVFAQRLAKGDLTPTQYITYLLAIGELFSAMEYSIEYDIPDKNLYRSTIILRAYEEIQADYGPLVVPVIESAKEYKHFILGCAEDDQRNSHIFLNYMPLLMGGSMIKKVIPYSTAVYEFNSRPTCVSLLRGLKTSEDQIVKGFAFYIKIMNELEEKTKNVAA